MGKTAGSKFHQTLTTTTQIIDQTLMLLNVPATGLEKVPWSDVKKSAEQMTKQATTAGMFWSGKKPKLAAGQENIKVFCDALQGFLLVCHGSTVGAGPTLQNAIRMSAKLVVDSSLQLLNKAISLSEAHDAEQKTIIPQLVGCVWEACNALNKTPTTNSVAVGRNLAHVAASIKDVIREMGELKEADVLAENGLMGSISETESVDIAAQGSDAESACSLDIDDRLSTEEMEVAKSVRLFICSILDVIKELLYAITGISQRLKENDVIYLHPLERILEICQEISVQVDELGACCYPPQEIQQIKVSAQKVHEFVHGLHLELQKIEGASLEGFELASGKLENSFIVLNNVLVSSDCGVEDQS